METFEIKNYLLLARSGDGYIQEKVNVQCSIDMALTFVQNMMRSSPRLVRGEIIDGNRTHIGDFSVKPCLFVYRDEMGEFSTTEVRR